MILETLTCFLIQSDTYCRPYHRGEGTAVTRRLRWAQQARHRQAGGPLCGDGGWQQVHIRAAPKDHQGGSQVDIYEKNFQVEAPRWGQAGHWGTVRVEMRPRRGEGEPWSPKAMEKMDRGYSETVYYPKRHIP